MPQDMLTTESVPRKNDELVAQRAAVYAEPQQFQEHFRELVAAVEEYAIFLMNEKGEIQSWNSGAEHIKGWRAEEIVGQHFSAFYPPGAVASGWPDHELRVAEAAGRFGEEGWRLRKDGSRFWASVTITALRHRDGSLRGFLKITRDLTKGRIPLDQRHC